MSRDLSDIFQPSSSQTRLFHTLKSQPQCFPIVNGTSHFGPMYILQEVSLGYAGFDRSAANTHLTKDIIFPWLGPFK